MNLYVKFILIFLKCFIVCSCAAIMSPPGGETDITPPEIIKIDPANGAINYKNNFVELYFSEYLDESSVYNSITVLPNSQNKPEILYKGNKILISFIDSLIKNQTYIISINRNLKDEHKIKFERGMQFAFSTGDKIDVNSISGKLFYSNPGSVQLWKIKNELDINFFYKRAPDYSIDASDDGQYEFKYLSPGSYRIVAVDQLFSGIPIATDKILYGLPSQPIIELINQEKIENINIYIPDKKYRYQMVSADWTEGPWGYIEFSKSISNYDNKFPLDIIYKDSIKAKIEVFQDPLNNSKLHFKLDRILQDYITISTNQFRNNEYARFDSNAIKIKMDTLKDTTAISIIRPIENKKLQIEENNISPLRLVFSCIIDTIKSSRNFILTQDSIEIEHVTEWESPISLKLYPLNNWAPKKNYKLDLNMKSIIPSFKNKSQDSLKSILFNTSSYKKYGSIFLRFSSEISKNLKVQLQSFEKKDVIFENFLFIDSAIKFENIPEGNYSLLFYQDIDGNGELSTGSLALNRPGEWFSFYSDTVKIRSNWELEINNLELKY